MTPITDREFLILMARAERKDYEEFKRLGESYGVHLRETEIELSKPDLDEGLKLRLQARIISTIELIHSFQCREGMASRTYGRICHQLAQHGVAWESEGPTLEDRYNG